MPTGRQSQASDGKGTTQRLSISRLVPQLPRGEMKPLTATEARELRPNLIAALRDYLTWTDEAIWLTGRKTRKQQQPAEWAIWSDMDDEEITTVVDGWLGIGQRSAVAAASVRNVVSFWKQIQVAVIIGPRFLKTVRFYAENGGLGLPW